jgi:hypothetical protein
MPGSSSELRRSTSDLEADMRPDLAISRCVLAVLPDQVASFELRTGRTRPGVRNVAVSVSKRCGLSAALSTDLIGRGTVRAAGSCCASPEQGPRVGGVVLGYRRREHRRALLVAGRAAAEVFDGRLRLPALEEVDAAGVDQISGDGEVEAASCPACRSTMLTQPAR